MLSQRHHVNKPDLSLNSPYDSPSHFQMTNISKGLTLLTDYNYATFNKMTEVGQLVISCNCCLTLCNTSSLCVAYF